MVQDYKGNEHIGLENFIGEYRRDLQVDQVIIWNEGSPGGSSRENLELVLAKSLTRKDERVESQSKGTEKKILIPPSFCDVGR